MKVPSFEGSKTVSFRSVEVGAEGVADVVHEDGAVREERGRSARTIQAQAGGMSVDQRLESTKR